MSMSVKNIIGHILLFALIVSPVVAVIVKAIKEDFIGELVILFAATFLFIGLLYLAAWCITT